MITLFDEVLVNRFRNCKKEPHPANSRHTVLFCSHTTALMLTRRRLARDTATGGWRDATSFSPRCPAGHLLVSHTLPTNTCEDSSGVCDECRQPLDPTFAAHCSPCNWDLCAACLARAERQQRRANSPDTKYGDAVAAQAKVKASQRKKGCFPGSNDAEFALLASLYQGGRYVVEGRKETEETEGTEEMGEMGKIGGCGEGGEGGDDGGQNGGDGLNGDGRMGFTANSAIAAMDTTDVHHVEEELLGWSADEGDGKSRGGDVGAGGDGHQFAWLGGLWCSSSSKSPAPPPASSTSLSSLSSLSSSSSSPLVYGSDGSQFSEYDIGGFVLDGLPLPPPTTPLDIDMSPLNVRFLLPHDM